MIVTNVPHSVASPAVLNMYLACPTPPLVQQQDTAVVTGTGCSTAPSLPFKMHWMAHSSMCEHCQIMLCAPQVNPDGTARTLAPDEPGFQDQVLEALQSVQQAYMASQVRNLKGPTEESLCSCIPGLSLCCILTKDAAVAMCWRLSDRACSRPTWPHK